MYPHTLCEVFKYFFLLNLEAKSTDFVLSSPKILFIDFVFKWGGRGGGGIKKDQWHEIGKRGIKK